MAKCWFILFILQQIDVLITVMLQIVLLFKFELLMLRVLTINQLLMLVA
jgi:hypothetical protein